MPEQDPFLAKIRDSQYSNYHAIKAAYDREQERQRQLAHARQRDWEQQQQRELARHLQLQMQAEAERQHRYRDKEKLMDMIAECKRRRWSYEPNTLLLGTVRDHPLTGLPLTIPDHLHDLYHDRKHLTELPIWFRGGEHGLTLGATGSGKFTSIIAANMMLFDGGIFVIDPKGQACAVTGNARRKKFQSAYRLDPFDITEFAEGAYRVPLASYNPLDALNPDEESFPDDVLSFVEILVTPQEGDGNTQFFLNQAKLLLTALIIYVKTAEILEGQRNLAKVHEILCSKPEDKDFLFEDMETSRYEQVRFAATTHKGMTPKTRDGIWLQAMNDLALFSLPVTKRATSYSSFDIGEIFEGKCTLYVVLDNNRLKSHNRWLRLVMSAALMEAVRRRGTKKGGAPSLWIVDEARQLGTLPLIPEAYRLLRDYGVRMWTFWQSLQDLQTSYPNDWQSMEENSFVQLLSCNNIETAKHFSELAGKYRETHISTGVSRSETFGTSSSFSTSMFGSGGFSRGPQGGTTSGSSGGSSTRTDGESHSVTFTESTSRAWQWAERIQTNDILSMPIDQMLLRCPGELAGFANKHMYYNNAFLEWLASGNPFYTAPQPQPLFPRLELGRVPEKEDYLP